MERLPATMLTVLVGGLVATQAPANASLGRHVSDLGATLVSLLISLAIIAVLLIASGDAKALTDLSGFRPEHALGGIAGAAVVYGSLVAVRPLGAGGVAAALVCSQLIVAAVLDKFGPLGLDRTAGLAHQPRNPLAGDAYAAVAQLGMHPRPSVGAIALSAGRE